MQPSARIAILGGGPAGVGAAWKLRREKRAEVVLFEQGEHFGGNAGSFQWAGQWLDFGSHRLHPATEPSVMSDVRALLGADLLDRPRHGRIRLLGQWIHFPLKPVDLFFRLDKRFAAGSLKDMLGGKRAANGGAESFASVLEASLGPTICRHFYFPYAEKLWGRAPSELSAIQARRRVSASSFGKLAKKVLGQVPGFKKPGAGRFFYPREGFGQISRAYAEAALREGADLRLGWRASAFERAPGDAPERGWIVEAEPVAGGAPERAAFDYVWSTIPITALARAARPAAPPEVQVAARSIHYRSMILVYLQVPVERFSEYDAHYFPGRDTRITRLQEPKNYSALGEPRQSTVLCAELPCSREDDVWSWSAEELGRLVAEDLARSGIALPAPPRALAVRKLPQAYPIYVEGYQQPFEALDRWVGSLPRVLSYGRQGLFAHDNTHHALFMAYSACECLLDGRFDLERWEAYRRQFETHVVED